MNIKKQVTKAMELIQTRITQIQKDIEESKEYMTKYKADKATCAFNRMAIVCGEEEINTLKEIHEILKATKKIRQ